MTAIISIVFIIIYIGINRIITKTTYESLSKQYSYISEKIELTFSDIYDDLDQVTANYVMNEYVQKTLSNQPMNSKDIDMLKKTLSYQNKSYMDYYLIIDNKDNIYAQKDISIDIDKFKNSDLYEGLGNKYSHTSLMWERDTVFGSNEMSIFAARYIHELNSDKDPGIVYLKLNNKIFDTISAQIKDDSFIYLILDNHNEICFEQMREGYQWNQEIKNNIIERISENEESYLYDLDEGIVSSEYDANTGFTILVYAPKEITNQVIWQTQKIMVILFLLSYIVTLLGIIVFTNRLTDPIKKVSHIMKEFDDTKLNTTIVLDTNTELDYIGHAYNDMLTNIKTLMKEVQNKESELRESELRTLLYQIRPHFLYNTLDTIYMLARIQKESTIMKMIQALSKFLRINLNNGIEEMEIKKELEHVSAYLDIQKIRKNNLFEYQIQYDDAIKNMKIMKMILQPISENCIKYGFQDIYEGGKIWIRVFLEETYLAFSIENNGTPIEEEQLLQLNKLENITMDEIDSVIRKKEGGFGICNVVKRLRLKYNDKIRFYYIRKESGTECIIKVDKDLVIANDKEELL